MKIVCAALKSGDHIICGVRHFDGIMRDQIQAAGLRHQDFEQGFVDNNGNFLNRKDALRLVESNGQLKQERRAKLKELYSEDLY